MADRVVKVTLTAQVAQYAQAMDEAARKTREVGSESEKLAQKKQAFQTLGTTLMGVGGAMTALTASVVKAGVEYNTLQQTSRAALTTLLGGAQQANAQMDKLDAFAKTSPFAKTTFITAQQQMLAFGIESKKVIPYLDAIGEAVAAAGGSNQQLGEIAFIMAQISSAGKITAQDLMQFGQRGVNAAEIIGSQMGKTGAQIRQDITDGALGADQALDALAAGMKDKFDGASANVKMTFAGAMDRVKAAWRDLSADLTAPLVGPNGGGLFVDLLNRLADVMRSFQALPEPVKYAGGAIFALAGIAALASGAFIAAVPKIAAYNAAIATLGGNAQRASRLVGVLAKGAGVAAGFLALTKAAEMAATAMGQMGDGAKTANDTLSLMLSKDYDDIFAGITSGTEDMGDALNYLLSNDPGDAFNRWGSDLFAFTGLRSSVGEARKQFGLMGDELARLVTEGNADRAAEMFDEIRAKAEEQGYSVDQLNEIMPQYQDALKGVANEAELTADATDVAADSLVDLQAEADAAADALDATSKALDGVAGSALSMGDAQDKALSSLNKLADAAKAQGATLDGANDASIRLRDSMRDVEQSHRDSADAIIQNTGDLKAAQKEWETGRQKVIDMRVAKGEDIETATAWANENLGSASEVTRALEEVYQAWLNLPENRETKYRVEAEDAMRRLAALKKSIDGMPQYKSITLETITLSNNRVISPNAGGGIYHNKVKSFAGGGMEPGIYPFTAGGIHKFAEEYAEAYISMDPRRRSRSEQVYQRVGREMGFSPAPQAEQRPINVNVNVEMQPTMTPGQVGVIVADKVTNALRG